MEGALEPTRLIKHRHLLRDIDNLTQKPINRSDLQRAFTPLGKQFGLAGANKKEYASLNANRLKVMLRHLRQAQGKNKQPSWVEKVIPTTSPNNGQGSDADEDEDAADDDNHDKSGDETGAGERSAPDAQPDASETKQPEQFFGWCPELRQAWKCSANDTSKRQYAKKELRLAEDDMMPPIAEWEDGTSHAVPELTTLAARSINEQQPAKVALSIHWSGRTQEGYPVVVKDRTDRSLLVSCYVSGKQVLQVDAHKEGHDRAKTVVMSIARKYAEGSLDRAHLYRERGRLLKQIPRAPTHRIPTKTSDDSSLDSKLDAAIEEIDACDDFDEKVANDDSDHGDDNLLHVMKKPGAMTSESMVAVVTEVDTETKDIGNNKITMITQTVVPSQDNGNEKDAENIEQAVTHKTHKHVARSSQCKRGGDAESTKGKDDTNGKRHKRLEPSVAYDEPPMLGLTDIYNEYL